MERLELLGGLAVEGDLGPPDVALEPRVLRVEVVQEAHQPVAALQREVDRADVLGDLGHHPVDLALDLLEAVAGLLVALLALAQGADLGVVLGDLLEDLEVALDALRRLGVQRLVRVAVEQLAQHPVVLLRQLVEPQQLAQHHRVLAQRLVDQPLALLDALGDLHLALAVEQRHGAHLAQVHAHRVVGLLLRVQGEVGGLLAVALVEGDRHVLVGLAAAIALGPIDDRDAELVEADVDLVQLVGQRRDLVGQQVVDLVVEEIALLPAELDELLDGGYLVFDQILGCGGHFRLLRWARGPRPVPLLALGCRTGGRPSVQGEADGGLFLKQTL